jgi:hypothetical protein
MQRKPAQPVILDLAGPHLLERHYEERGSGGVALDNLVKAKLKALTIADYCIVSGDSQRYYFLSFLLRAGREDLASRLVTIPMPLPPELPQRGERSGEVRYLFGGVFLPWQDPSLGLRTVSQELNRLQRGTLTLIGGRHPNYDLPSGVYRELFQELSHNPRVRTLPMVPYEEYLNHLLNADVANDLMAWNLERQLAVTIRTTTSLWAGVPVIYNRYSDLSKSIRHFDAGWCVEGEQELREVLTEIDKAPELLINKSKNAQRLAQHLFSWDHSLRPLLHLLSAPNDQPRSEWDIVTESTPSYALPLAPHETVVQQFATRLDGLCGVQCRVNVGDGANALHLSLFQHESSAPAQLIAKREISAHEIRVNEWAALHFDALPDSAGREFSLELRTLQSGGVLSPLVTKHRPYPLGPLYAGERPLHGHALCLKTHCLRTP